VTFAQPAHAGAAMLGDITTISGKPSAMRIQRLALAIALTAIYACSGGGAKNPPPATNTPPQLTSPNQVTVNENQRGVFFSLEASDADGDALTFAITGVDAAQFSVDTNTGALQFRRPPNFEIPSDNNSDNVYELTAVVTDVRGAQTIQALTVTVANVEFAYEFLSPLPDTIVELERYSRLPIALWMEYDYPEKIEVKCDGEILNPASDSRMTWTGSISLGNGRVTVDCVFWRGGEVLAQRPIPVRHQHVISDDRHLIYDAINDQFIIPHPMRLETLLIDAGTGTSTKRYPWVGEVPQIQDMVADTMNGGAFYIRGNKVERLAGSGDSTAVITDFAGTIPRQPQSTISYDAAQNRLYASGLDHQYAAIDLGNGLTSELNYSGELATPAGSRVESTLAGNRLIFASGAGTGVTVVSAEDATVTATYPLTDNQRWGEIVYSSARDSLFVRTNPLLRRSLQTGNYTALNISESQLAPSSTLALDSNRDRLATISGGKLLALDPDTGAPSVLFDSAVGAGAVSSGLAGIWVAADSTHALAVDRTLGRYFAIDLRTGDKTLRTYQLTGRDNSTANLSPQDFSVTKAKFNSDGRFAVVQTQQRDLNSDEHYLDLVSLENGSSKRLAVTHVVDFSFSRPTDQLTVLQRGDNDEYSIAIFALPTGDLLENKNLPAISEFTPLALQKIDANFYLLGRTLENSTLAQQLMVMDANQQFAALATYPDLGTGKNTGFGISAIYENTVLALEFAEQSPEFWHIAEQSVFQMDFTTFQGSEQPKDFYTIDDYRELYFFRANAGLHLCWRSNCAIQAN
jgi:hypothetical protein